VAPFHGVETLAVPTASWLELIVKPVKLPTQLPPIGPSARLKLSSTAVVGKVGAVSVAEMATVAVALPPRPSVTVSVAV